MTQEQDVLNYIEKNGSIDPAQAFFELGIYRLGARIFDLRAKGHAIQTETHTKNGKKWAVYTLKKPLPGEQTGERQKGGNVGTNPTSEITTLF